MKSASSTLPSSTDTAACRPRSVTRKNAKSVSISVTVSVDARLIVGLRAKPCAAALITYQTRLIRRAPFVSCRVEPLALVTHDAAVVEVDDAAAERVHDLGVVGSHDHRRAELVHPREQLDDLPARHRVEVPGRL